MFKPMLPVLFALFAAPASFAQHYLISGVGTMSCTEVIAHVKAEDNPANNEWAFALMSWAQGYISGKNISELGLGKATYQDLNSLTTSEIWAGLYGFCVRNPKKDFSVAVHDVAKKLNSEKP